MPAETEAKPPSRIPSKRGKELPQPPFLNLCGDYRFLRGGYWALIDAELVGVKSRPTPMQAMTGQNAAACLAVARVNGMRVPNFSVCSSAASVNVPALLMPVAGLTDACYQVHSPRSAETQWESASQHGTRAVLQVEFTGKLRSFKVVLGLTTKDEFAGLAWKIWQVFGLPLSLAWVIEDEAGNHSFLGLDPQPLHELTERELRMLEEVSQRPLSPS